MSQLTRMVSASGLVFLAKYAPFAENLDSNIADFKNGLIGSFQAFWDDVDVTDGSLELWVSNLQDPAYFAPFPNSLTDIATVPSPIRSVLWNVGVIGFRYGFVRYTKGTGTMGSMSVVAIGKHSGGFA